MSWSLHRCSNPSYEEGKAVLLRQCRRCTECQNEDLVLLKCQQWGIVNWKHPIKGIPGWMHYLNACSLSGSVPYRVQRWVNKFGLAFYLVSTCQFYVGRWCLRDNVLDFQFDRGMDFVAIIFGLKNAWFPRNRELGFKTSLIWNHLIELTSNFFATHAILIEFTLGTVNIDWNVMLHLKCVKN